MRRTQVRTGEEVSPTVPVNLGLPDPSVSEASLLLVAVHGQPAVFGPEHILGWFERNAPSIDPTWIADSVNDDHRRQHCPGPRDVLFRRTDGRLELYAPALHGWWSASGTPTDAPLGESWATRRIPLAHRPWTAGVAPV
jgi:hypothetical protein